MVKGTERSTKTKKEVIGMMRSLRKGLGLDKSLWRSQDGRSYGVHLEEGIWKVIGSYATCLFEKSSEVVRWLGEQDCMFVGSVLQDENFDRDISNWFRSFEVTFLHETDGTFEKVFFAQTNAGLQQKLDQFVRKAKDYRNEEIEVIAIVEGDVIRVPDMCFDPCFGYEGANEVKGFDND